MKRLHLHKAPPVSQRATNTYLLVFLANAIIVAAGSFHERQNTPVSLPSCGNSCIARALKGNYPHKWIGYPTLEHRRLDNCFHCARDAKNVATSEGPKG